MAGRIPYRPQLPTPQQVGMGLAVITLTGPMALGGTPVVPVTVDDERRRQQDQVQQVSESSVGIYQTSAEAEVGLALSQQRLAVATGEIEEVGAQDVTEQDVFHAAERVFSGEVQGKPGRKFRAAFTRTVWDNVDLYILRGSEAQADS